jgi:uncharacterized membrane protein
MLSRILIFFMGAFYVFAGVNHFINPQFYEPLIPDYLPWNSFINYASGVLEIVLGLGIFIPKYRKISAQAILILLVLFIPSHIHFIQIGACIPEGLCTPMWLAWLRLVLIHPVLMFWAYFVSKYHNRP